MNRAIAHVAPLSRTCTTSRLITSKYSSILARSWPPSASYNSVDHGLQVHLSPRCWLGIWPGSFPCVWCWRARAWGRWLTAPIGLACPHQPRLPPWASPAPMLRRRPSFGTGSRLRTRLWYSASPSMVFSLYISLVFSFSCIDRQLSFFILSLLLSTLAPSQPPSSVSNGAGLWMQVRVWVGTELFPNWWSGLSIHLNCQLEYSLMEISQPVWFGWVVSTLPCRSICRLI